MEKFLKGEILTAEKLNELVAELNNLSENSNDIITGSSSASGQSDYFSPHFVKPDFSDMHAQDGIPVILDQLQGVESAGLYARNIEAVTYTGGSRQQNKNLVKLSNYVSNAQSVYQRIRTDSKGNVTNSDVILFDICSDEMPTATLPNYEKGQNGTIYRRLARIAANCRVEGVGDQSLAYKVISTPEANLPPFISNERGTCGFGLINSLDGNTLPVKRLKAGENITIKDCGASLLISASGSSGGGNCDCKDCNRPCICAQYPLTADNNIISLKYHPCEFWTDYEGYLRISCSITSKINNGGGSQYSFNAPLYQNAGGSVSLNYSSYDFAIADCALTLKSPLRGVVDSTGKNVTWAELANKTVPLFYFYVDCTEVSIGAGYKDGYLKLFGINS